jgi:hypothetical protein
MTELISVNTWWTIWLLVHLVLAVSLVGALTHQAVAVAMPARKARLSGSILVDAAHGMDSSVIRAFGRVRDTERNPRHAAPEYCIS